MKAMILAAGLGTRLRPLTDDRPKALVEIGSITLLEHTIVKLIDNGFDEIIINVHHFAEMITSFIRSKNFSVKIYISDETEWLLDTGGGIFHASKFLDGDAPFLVHNVDIITDINLNLFYKTHSTTDAIATLAVGKRDSSRVFLFDENMKLSGWKNLLTKKEVIPSGKHEHLTEYAFAGIHVISPDIFNLISSKGSFSIVDAYLGLCNKYSIRGFDVTNNFVLDVGKPNSIALAEDYLKVKSEK